jgi:DegV family protein with EDD domain
MAAIEAARNRANVEGVLESVRSTLRRVRLYAILNTVQFLAKSGRVSVVELGLSTLLQIKPMVELREGVISSLGRIRTWSKAVSALTERVRTLGPVERLAVLHSNTLECAADFRERLRDILPGGNNTLTVDVTTVIGTHVGPHGLGIAAVVK